MEDGFRNDCSSGFRCSDSRQPQRPDYLTMQAFCSIKIRSARFRCQVNHQCIWFHVGQGCFVQHQDWNSVAEPVKFPCTGSNFRRMHPFQTICRTAFRIFAAASRNGDICFQALQTLCHDCSDSAVADDENRAAAEYCFPF